MIVRDSQFLKASTVDGRRFQSWEQAEAAIRAEWPDVMPGPEFNLTGEGYAVAAAINQFDLRMAEAPNGDTVWLIVVETKNATNARAALAGLLRYWANRRAW